MSIAGILSSSLSQLTGIQNGYQTQKSEFQQLGKDLASGNITAANQDYIELTSTASQNTQRTAANTLAQDFGALGQALGAGNLTAAQKAYTAVQQDMQNAQQTHVHGGHHHHGGGGWQDASNGNSANANSNNILSLLSSLNTQGTSATSGATASTNGNSLLSALSSLSLNGIL